MKSFEELIKDLDEEERESLRVGFNLEKFKEILESPIPVKLLNFSVIMYILLRVPFGEKIPPIEQIAKDLKLNIEIVKEEIINLKNCGVLENYK